MERSLHTIGEKRPQINIRLRGGIAAREGAFKQHADTVSIRLTFGKHADDNSPVGLIPNEHEVVSRHVTVAV